MKSLKCFAVLSLLLFSLSLFAQSPFSGTYQGNVEGTQATCTLTQTQSQLSGQVHAGGYIYQLSGTVEGNFASGQVVDLQDQSQLPFNAQIQGNLLTFTLNFQDEWGNTQQISLPFQKGTSNSSGSPIAATSGGKRIPQDGFERDPQLVGIWGQSSSQVSGTFTMARSQMMEVFADGTYAIGGNRIVGGGRHSSYSAGSADEVINRGKWRTQNGYLYVDEGYGWEKYCGYYVDANNLMLKFDNGERDVWSRY